MSTDPYSKAKRIIAERNEAIEQARFWRRIAVVLGATITADLTLTLLHNLGAI